MALSVPAHHRPVFDDSAANILISLHLPKTGGSTFAELLKRQAGRLWYTDYSDRPSQEDYVSRKLGNLWEDCQRYDEVHTAARQHPDRVVVIHGHFYATKYNHVFPDAMKAVWVRDPIERIASQYFFWQRKPDRNNAFCRQMLSENLGLVDFARLPGVSNLQTRYLASHRLADFTFIGITERFDAGLERFCSLFGIAPPKRLKAQRVNTDRAGAGYEIPDADRAALMELNARDLALYAEARTLADVS